MGQDEPQELREVALLVRHVPSAISDVVSVRHDQTLADAQTLMSANEYSQLAVISGTDHLVGAVSWRSIAQRRLSKAEITLSDATMRCGSVNINDDLLEQIDTIYDDDFVFVKDDSDKVCGIITTADLTKQFRDLTQQFFQVSDIEGRLRRFIDRAFNRDELREVTGQKKLESAGDMTFGQYEYLLKEPTNWQRMGWRGIERTTFIEYLDEARIVRNRVMHSGGELEHSQKQKLERLFNLMRALDPRP